MANLFLKLEDASEEQRLGDDLPAGGLDAEGSTR